MPTKQSQPNAAALVRVARRRLESTAFEELVGIAHDVARTPWVKAALWKGEGIRDLGDTYVLAGDGVTRWPARALHVPRSDPDAKTRAIRLLVYVGQDGDWGCVERAV